MNNIIAYAIRNEGSISVNIFGSLPNSCYVASIVDKYPGGNIIYVVDPGVAQVFIEETLRPGSSMCPMSSMPWASHVCIPDNSRDKVAIFINGNKVLTVDTKEPHKEFIVIALVQESPGNLQGCSVVPSGEQYLAIYKKVFGPSTNDECIQWVSENCTVADR